MSLAPGTRLGVYEITAPIGAGGMGEVYRATDGNLKRSVAIKVLPASMAADADRLARFQREAEVLAALNHPNIAAIYGLERTPDVTALVMELVEGEDLSAHITRGAIPLVEALPIAKQIADALDAAHELGIIHRDLKPANIKVRADGTVKVLDFGLAKAMDPAGASSADAMNSPTLTARATQMGMILGTAAYMAPEQAKGKSVDRRADIWAFGVVLYEMLTGQRAFKGDDISETLASVLKDTPAFAALPAWTPARLRDLLARCLQKDPRTRQRDIGDVKLELDAIAANPVDPSAVMTTAATAVARSSLTIYRSLWFVGLVMGAVIGWALFHTPSTAVSVPARFIVSSPDDADPNSPVLTPDGRTLIFVAGRLYKRDIATFTATPLPGTEGAAAPMVSPDGRWVAFFANGKIRKVSLAGGDSTPVADANGAMPGAAWGPDNTLLFSKGWATGLSAVSADGGAVRELTQPDRALGERAHWRPRMLPGGQQILFTIWMAGSSVNDSRIGILDWKTGQHRALFPGTDATYLHDGHILYFHAGAWHLVPFDAASGKTTGDPVTVLDDALGVSPDGGSSANPLWVSDNGTLAYLPGPLYPKVEFAWADRTGKMESLGLPPRAIESASLSPDGRRIVVGRLEGGAFELWMDDVTRKTEDRLDIKGSNFDAIWAPKGEAIAFISERKGEYDTYTARPDGTNVQPLLTSDVDESPQAWTHDGRLVEKEWHPDGTVPLMVAGINDPSQRQVINPNLGTNARSVLSPNDRWLMYSSFVSGRSEVYVEPFPAGTPIVRVSSNGGINAHWVPSGNEIVFQRDKDVVSVPFREEGGRAVIGSETTLFHLGAAVVNGITPDGRHFLVMRPAEPEPPPGVRVVLNWFEELKAGALVKK